MLINFCFRSSLKSATDCCQTERHIQQDAFRRERIARVAEQYLHENCPKAIEKGTKAIY